MMLRIRTALRSASSRWRGRRVRVIAAPWEGRVHANHELPHEREAGARSGAKVGSCCTTQANLATAGQIRGEDGAHLDKAVLRAGFHATLRDWSSTNRGFRP